MAEFYKAFQVLPPGALSPRYLIGDQAPVHQKKFALVSLPGCLLELEFMLPNPGGMLGKGVGIVKFTTRPRKCERTVLVCFAWLVFFL